MIAFLIALGMQWLLMRRMGRSLEQFQRQKLANHRRQGAQQDAAKPVQKEQQ